MVRISVCELISNFVFGGCLLVDLIDHIDSHLACQEHVSDSVQVIILLKQMLIHNEVGESKLVKPHVVLASFLLRGLTLVLLLLQLRLAQLWLWHVVVLAAVFDNWSDIDGKNDVTFVRCIHLYKLVVHVDLCYLIYHDFFLFLFLCFILDNEADPDFLTELHSVKRQT